MHFALHRPIAQPPGQRLGAAKLRARPALAPHGGSTPPAPLVFLLLGPTQHVLGQAPEVAAPTTSGSRRCPACPPCHLPLRPCALWCLNSAGLCEQGIEIVVRVPPHARRFFVVAIPMKLWSGPPFPRAIFAQHPATGRSFGASCAC